MPRKSPTGRTKRRRSASVPRPRRASSASGSGRVHLYVGISLDGYIAAPDGGVDWLTPYADAHAGFAPFIKTIGSIVMGRVTYDHAVARGYRDFGETPTYVVTHRPFESPSRSLMPFSGELSALVEQMRARHPGDIWLLGGGILTRSFIEADLIDIWSVAFVPTLIGAGLPMFPQSSFAERRLRLVRHHTYPSGVVELRYERWQGGKRSGRAR